jgi:hypothetical protein
MKAGRRRIDKLAASKKPTGRQGVWTAMRELEQFTLGDVQAATDIAMSVISTYARRLRKAGYIEVTGDWVAKPQGRPRIVFRLAKDPGIEAPALTLGGEPSVVGRCRENLWRTIRMLSKRGDFSSRELAIHAATEEVPVSLRSAKNFAGALNSAGYLIVTAAPPTPASWRYRLGYDTGPLTPVLSPSARAVFDTNLRRWIRSRADLKAPSTSPHDSRPGDAP